LSYTNITGATNASLGFDHFSYSNAGPYVAIATNSLGTATSQVATLLFIPVLQPSVTKTSLVLNWEGSFTLQSATNVTGPYLDLAPATSPFTNQPATNERRRFFRLRGTE
jgi:hypothetical protein